MSEHATSPFSHRFSHWFEGEVGGIILRLIATAMFSVMTLCVRLASFEAPVGQIVFWRSFVALIPIVFYMYLCGDLPVALRSSRPGRLFYRSILGCAAMFTSFVSLAYLPLSQASAIAFLTPIFVSIGGVIFFRERLTGLLIFSILSGFLGVLVILSDKLLVETIDTLSWIGVVAGLATVILSAFARVQVKELTKTERAATIAFYFALYSTIAGLVTYFWGWAPHDWNTLSWLIGAGLAGGAAHIALTEAVSRAPISVLAPFEYSAIIWVFLFDYLFFEQDLAPLGLLGTAIILVASLVYFLRKEK